MFAVGEGGGEGRRAIEHFVKSTQTPGQAAPFCQAGTLNTVFLEGPTQDAAPPDTQTRAD